MGARVVPKTSSILETAILAEGASTVGYIPSDARSEPATRRASRPIYPDLSLATVSPADAEAVSAPGEHLSCELDLGFRTPRSSSDARRRRPGTSG